MKINKGVRLCAVKWTALFAIVTLSLITTHDAMADGTDASEVEVITVTARKTEESLQTVPVTVTVIGGDVVRKFNYDKIADLVTRIPTLNVQVGGSGSGGQLSIRGIGSSNISAAFDSAIAFDFDGVQVSTMRIVQSSFFDVQQIEVLKGPQSLYFGKSASAGVISLRSANPGDEWEFGGKVAYEFEEKGVTVEAFAGGPITDKFGFRVAARWNDISEWMINDAPAVNKKRGQENINVRGTFQFDPTDNFSANLKLNYIRHENDGGIGNAQVDCGPNGVADDISFLRGGIIIPPGYTCEKLGSSYYKPDLAPALSVKAHDQDIKGGVPFGESDIFFGRLELDWDLSDDLNLTSVTGYLDQSAQDSDIYTYGGEFGGISFGGGMGLTDHQLEQFTQEFRLTSNYDAPVNFMLGVFYESRDIEYNSNQFAVNIAHVAADPITGNTTDYYKRHLYDNEAWSIWGSIRWDITDKLEFSGGVRWTDETKINQVNVPYVHLFLGPGPNFIGSGFESGDITFKDDNLSPEATLSYAVNDDINLYASYKTGFKSGGIDNSALPSNGLTCFGSDDEEVRAQCADSLVFDSETATGGEIGAKMQFSDRRFTLNMSAFYYVFDNLQVQNFDAVAIQFQTGNAGEVTTKGLDADFSWITNVDGLSIFGALAYTDTKFTDDFDPNPNNDDDTENLKSRTVARAPKFAGNIGADWRAPVGNGLEFGLTGNMQFSSSYWTNEDTLEDDIKQGSFVTFDLAASVGEINGKWEIAVVGRNLGDKYFVNSSGGRPFLVPGVGDDQVVNINRGRQIFLEGSVRF